MLEGNRLGVNENTPVPTYAQDVEGKRCPHQAAIRAGVGKAADVPRQPGGVRIAGPAGPAEADAAIPPARRRRDRPAVHEARGNRRGDDTLAVFIGDNGYQWREHGAEAGDCVDSQGQDNGTLCGPTGKARPYRDSVKVPFYVRWPANPDVAASTTAANMVTNVDLAATVMDVVDARPSGSADQPVMDGWSLFSYWRRPYLFTENLVGENEYVPGLAGVANQLRALRALPRRPGHAGQRPRLPGVLLGDRRSWRAPEPAGGQRATRPGEPSLGALPALLSFYSTCVGQIGAPEDGKYPCP